WPAGYNLLHFTSPVLTAFSVSFILPALILSVIIAAIALTKSRTLAFAAVWFIIWLLPPLVALRSFLPQYFVQERYLYLPAAGICLALALGIEWLANQRVLNVFGLTAARAVAAMLLIVFGYVGVIQNTVWRDTLTLVRHSVAVNPNSTYAHVSL